MIPTDVLDSSLIKYFEFNEAKCYTPHLKSWSIRFDTAKDRRLDGAGMFDFLVMRWHSFT